MCQIRPFRICFSLAFVGFGVTDRLLTGTLLQWGSSPVGREVGVLLGYVGGDGLLALVCSFIADFLRATISTPAAHRLFVVAVVCTKSSLATARVTTTHCSRGGLFV